MKKRVVFKIFYIILLIFILTNVKLYAKAYENTVSQSDADVVFSANVNKNIINPNEEFSVDFAVDRLPKNGLGIASFDGRLIYDSSKVKFLGITRYEGALKLEKGFDPISQTISNKEFANAECITFAKYSTGENSIKSTGKIYTLRFKAKDKVTGNIKMYFENNNGLNASSVITDSSGNVSINPSETKKYLKTNMNNIWINRAVKISLDKTSHTFKDGTAIQLQASLLPEGLTNKDVTWTSSNTNVARVTSDGRVRAGTSNGTCTITATTTDGTNLSATCNITVLRVTSIRLSKLEYTFYSEEPLKLSVIVSPTGTLNKIKWSTSDSKVATVDEEGNVKPKGAGTCTIWAVHQDKGYVTSCQIKVDKSFRKYLKGDITKDGKVDMEDVYTAVKRLARGTLSDEDKLIVEVTDNGIVDMEDIYKMLKYVAGKINSL